MKRLTKGDKVFIYHREAIHPATYRYRDNFGRRELHVVYVPLLGHESEIEDKDLYLQPRLAREEHPNARDHTLRKR